jgi:hypothetical protein
MGIARLTGVFAIIVIVMALIAMLIAIGKSMGGIDEQVMG